MKGFGALFDKLNSFIIIIVLIAVLVVVNLIAAKLPFKYDMTVEKVFTLSDQTKKVLKGLNKEVNVMAFYQEGKEDPAVAALLEEYVKAGKGKIRLEYADAEKNPIVAKKYDAKNEGIFNESIVFECEGNTKKLTSSDIYSINDAYGKSFSGEQQFTGALLFVSSPKLSRIYFLEGHQETNLEQDLFKLKNTIESEANAVVSLNLLKVDSIPKEADIIVVISPKRDLSIQEKAKMQDYLSKGGKAIFLFDVLSDDTKLTNFGEVLKTYGIGINNNFVVEEDREFFYSNNKMYLVPGYMDHSIVNNLGAESLAVIFPYALNLELLKTTDKNLSVEPILKTSDKSWIRYKVNDASASKTGDDIAGPANLALAATRDNTDDRNAETRLVVAGNAKFIENSMLDIQGNIDLFMNMLNWVENKKDSISIRPKMMNSNQMMVKGFSYILLLLVSILVIPLLAFGGGFYIWLKRRHA